MTAQLPLLSVLVCTALLITWLSGGLLAALVLGALADLGITAAADRRDRKKRDRGVPEQ